MLTNSIVSGGGLLPLAEKSRDVMMPVDLAKLDLTEGVAVL